MFCPLASPPALATACVLKQKKYTIISAMTDDQPWGLYWCWRKDTDKDIQSWWQRGEAKSTVQPMQPAREEDESASDESVQVVSPQLVTLCSPPAIPHFIYNNQPNRVGSKPSDNQPLGRFLPSPNRTFFNKGAQQEFDDLHMHQQLSPVTLVQCDVQPRRRGPRLTPMSFSERSKLAHTIAVRAVKQMSHLIRKIL